MIEIIQFQKERKILKELKKDLDEIKNKVSEQQKVFEKEIETTDLDNWVNKCLIIATELQNIMDSLDQLMKYQDVFKKDNQLNENKILSEKNKEE